MSGAIDQGLTAPWSSAEIDALKNRIGAKKDLDALSAQYRGKPQAALVDFLRASDDYATTLEAIRNQVRSERENPEPPPEPPAAPPADRAGPAGTIESDGAGGPEDLGDVYGQRAAEAADGDLVDQAFDDFEGTQPPPQAAAGQQEAKASPRPAQGATRSLRDIVRERPQAPGPVLKGDLASDAATVAGDIATGFGETPKAVVAGARNALNELAGAIDSAGAWVAVNVANAVGDKERAAAIEARRASGETALENLLPEVGDARSVTGGLVQGITQFVVGFAAGGKALKGAGLLGKLGTTGDVFLKSAFADAFAFDPAQQRLSNLIESNPDLHNPVTDFLAAKPGDSEATGRFKNALEGLGIGAALQGVFVSALSGMRAVNALKPAAPTAEQIATHVKEGLAPLGSKDRPPVLVRAAALEGQPVKDGLASAGKNAQGQEVFINFARIDTADDVKAFMKKTADAFAGDVADAQRGVQSFEATKALADDMGMEAKDLLARRRGPNGARVPFTAEEALAARRVYTASGNKLYELAERAAGPNAGEIDLYNLRRMMTTHLAIQNEVLGARTETARALGAWRIEAGAGEAQLKSIQALMESAGPDTQRMAAELVRLKQVGATPGALAQYVRKSAVGTIAQGIREVYVNGLLSGPLTHMVNATGNMATLFLSAAERFVARGISHATGSEAIAAGEAGAMLHGVIEGQRDALRAAWKATGDVPIDFLGKTDTPRIAAIASTRQDAFGKAVNVIGATTRAPSLMMGTADQYFKALNYRAELHATSVRMAASEGLSGKAFNARVAEIMANPPEHLKIAASDHAFYNTFNNATGEWGRLLLRLRESGGALNPLWIITPFIRTPVNIARYSFERTPLAPLVGQWRADILAGGARRDIALARVATGTMVMGITQAAVENGYVTGSRPADGNEAALWSRRGKQENSVKIGDTWYSYNRFDPFGMMMGFAADMQTTLSRGDVAPDDVDEWQEIMAGGIAAVSKTAMDKTFMRGFAQFNDMLADPERYGPKEINQLVTGFVPFTSLGGAISRLNDPTVRDVKTPIDAIAARIPGLSERIIPRRDLWGAPWTDPLGVQNSFNPLRARQEKDSPIDDELDRLRVFPSGIKWKTTLDGVAVNFSDYPKALDEYRRLAGNDLKHPAWNMGLKDFLDQTVSGNGPMGQVYRMYSDGEQGGKAAFIRDWIGKYRELAARKLLSDPKFADFRAYYDEQKAAQGAARRKVNFE